MRPCAENITGLKHLTEDTDIIYYMVEERSHRL